MNDKCIYCHLDADYVVQWGSETDQKKTCCTTHIERLLSEIAAPEMWVIKVKKT